MIEFHDDGTATWTRDPLLKNAVTRVEGGAMEMTVEEQAAREWLLNLRISASAFTEANLADLSKVCAAYALHARVTAGTIGKVFGFDCEETSGCPGTGELPDQTVPLGCVRAREHLRGEPHDCAASPRMALATSTPDIAGVFGIGDSIVDFRLTESDLLLSFDEFVKRFVQPAYSAIARLSAPSRIKTLLEKSDSAYELWKRDLYGARWDNVHAPRQTKAEAGAEPDSSKKTDSENTKTSI